MNPYTKGLLDELGDREASAWFKAWDNFESLVIEIYRTEKAGPEEQQQLTALTRWLLDHYPAWQGELESHWQELTAGGKKLRVDPFSNLLDASTAASFINNWGAMQMLPAAREAINLYLLDRLQAKGRHDHG